jgi:hypothetical protein
MSLTCPIKSISQKEDQYCSENHCQLWDDGIYDKYQPGCGLVSRENRRI